jgi:hypothetical protein
MQKIWIKTIFIISFMALSQTAFSQFLLEPYGGYLTSLSGEDKWNGQEFSYNGSVSGSRLGWSFNPLMVGFVGDYMWLNYKTTYNFDVDRTNFGVFVGANLNGGFRFWGEYLFDVKNDYDIGGNIYNEGSGWGAAVGYLFGNKKIALNLQYRNITLNKNQTSSLQYDIVSQEIFLTVSFPIYPFN